MPPLVVSGYPVRYELLFGRMLSGTCCAVLGGNRDWRWGGTSLPYSGPMVGFRRAELVIPDWEHGRDLYIAVVATYGDLPFSIINRSLRAGFYLANLYRGRRGGLWLGPR